MSKFLFQGFWHWHIMSVLSLLNMGRQFYFFQFHWVWWQIRKKQMNILALHSQATRNLDRDPIHIIQDPWIMLHLTTYRLFPSFWLLLETSLPVQNQDEHLEVCDAFQNLLYYISTSWIHILLSRQISSKLRPSFLLYQAQDYCPRYQKFYFPLHSHGSEYG